MKFKLDENLDVRLVHLMAEQGFEADSVLGESIAGVSDEGLFDACKRTGRILVTLDLDFANPLRFPPQSSPGILVLRPKRQNLFHVRSLLSSLIPRLRVENMDGQLWIAEPGRVRVHTPETYE